MYYEQHSILTGLVASEEERGAEGGLAALHEQFYPIIEGISPAPGCRVNWMWHLAVSEQKIYSKVSGGKGEAGSGESEVV